MRERGTQTWNTGGWLLALCLAWLWTRLASASLQPPTPTGLEEVVGPNPGGMYHMAVLLLNPVEVQAEFLAVANQLSTPGPPRDQTRVSCIGGRCFNL